MIVISDDEDEIEEIKTYEIQKKQEVNIINAPVVFKPEDKSSDSEDDVHVVEEVSHFKKYPKGKVFGSFLSRGNLSLQISNTRKQRGHNCNVVSHCSLRGGDRNFHNFWSSTAIRRLFPKEEVIRLEERREYVQLLERIFASVKLQNFSVNHLRPFRRQNVSLLTSPKQKTPPKTKFSNLEFIDLTSDSENDIIELSQELTPSEVNDIEEISCDTDDNVIDLEEEPKSSKTLLHTPSSKEPREIECMCPTSSRQSHDQLNVKHIPICYDSAVDGIGLETETENLHLNLINDDIANVIDLVDNDFKVSEKEEENAKEDQTEESFLPEITHEMQVLVHKAFTSRSIKVLVEAFNIAIHGRDIQTIKGSSWLNDEVINFYMCLLMERGKLRSYPSVYCFNTFFYVKLLQSGHSSLKRWTQKVDIFAYELLIVPIHLKVHWCLACVNIIEKRIEYYDSMGGINDDCGRTLLKYLEEEYFYKKAETFNISRWEIVNMKGIPDQLNGSDCGVFACTYAEYICRLEKLTFTQRDMPYFRVKMAYEILTKKLLL